MKERLLRERRERDREGTRLKERQGWEREISKERLFDCLREKERDRVWCKREKIIERETGMGKRNIERRPSEREKERDRVWCKREKIIGR